MLRSCVLLFCLAAAAPAYAGESGPAESGQKPRLAAGGYDLGMVERQSEVLRSGEVSLGTVTAPPVPGHLAVGGYLAYVLDDARLSSAVKGTGADLSAAYTGGLLGSGSTTALRLGYDWTQGPLSFSPNASQPVYSLLDPPHQGVSLSLSWSRDITPGLSLGGFAAAGRTPPPALSTPAEEDEGTPELRLGAGVGVKF